MVTRERALIVGLCALSIVLGWSLAGLFGGCQCVESAE